MLLHGEKIIFLIAIFLTACAGQSLRDQIDLKISMEPTEIVVGRQNNYKQSAAISWEITNRSTELLLKEKYSLTIGAGRVSETSTEVYSSLEKTVASGATERGVLTKVFEAVVGASGQYELRLILYEKISETSLREIDKAVFPFTWTVP